MNNNVVPSINGIWLIFRYLPLSVAKPFANALVIYSRLYYCNSRFHVV